MPGFRGSVLGMLEDSLWGLAGAVWSESADCDAEVSVSPNDEDEDFDVYGVFSELEREALDEM